MTHSVRFASALLTALAATALAVGAWTGDASRISARPADAFAPSAPAAPLVRETGHGMGERQVAAVHVSGNTAPTGSTVRRPAGGDVASPDAAAPDALLAPAQSTALITEDFENTSWPTGTLWRTFDNNGAEHGEYYWKNRCTGHHTARSAWAIGEGASGRSLACGATYPENLDSYMIYGPFSLAAYSKATLEFAFWLDSECQGTNCATKADRMWAMASTDGTNFYGEWWAGDWAHDPDAHPGGWNEDSISLDDYAGEAQVWIAFNFDSDGTTGFAGGAFVDDVVVRVEGGCSPTASIVRITPTARAILRAARSARSSRSRTAADRARSRPRRRSGAAMSSGRPPRSASRRLDSASCRWPFQPTSSPATTTSSSASTTPRRPAARTTPSA
ncbi:MAG: hypothetical protein IPG72_14570 [Ardenticatenales bacterium]|nr:hypothetical protein [Ardenticatenales bacterium]